MAAKEGDFVRWFSELKKDDVELAGVKGAFLGELYRNKFPVAPGFVITKKAFDTLIQSAGIKDLISQTFDEARVDDFLSLASASEKIRSLIKSIDFPSEINDAIIEAYDFLDVGKKSMGNAKGGALDILKSGHEPPFVAVRSSVALPIERASWASFAGQHESYLNIKGSDEVVENVKDVFSSFYTPRAINYMKKRGMKDIGQAVIVQEMIDSDKSGVMFSKNPIKNDSNILIEGVFGQGEGIVSGLVVPDKYVVSNDFNLVSKKIADKKAAFVRDSGGKTKSIKLTDERSSQEVLNGHELKILAQLAVRLEEHFEQPQNIEFVKAGDEVFVTQSRPITNEIQVSAGEIEGKVISAGAKVSPGVASGSTKVVRNYEELNKINKGDVAIAKMADPDILAGIGKAKAVISEDGGVGSHAGIIAREEGVSGIYGVPNIEKIEEGQIVTVDGHTGRIITGDSSETQKEIEPIVETKTEIKTVVNIPDYAERAASTGIKSLGLVRLEILIGSHGKHPLWYVKNESLHNYIEMLSADLRKISKPFLDIWIRTSDLREDEYSNLEGAPNTGGNPLLGAHGIRFSLRNLDIFEAELKAIKEVVDEFPEKKFGIIFPQVVSVKELKEGKEIMKKIGFPSNVKVGIMIETPAAVQIINDLCAEGIDFAVLGLNDLTQFTLAVDKEDENVNDIYNEMDPAVLNSINYVIRRCKKYNVPASVAGKSGISEDMVRFLVDQKIESVSVTPDIASKVSVVVREAESGINYPKKEIVTQLSEKTDTEDLILKALDEEDQDPNPDAPEPESDPVPVLTDAIKVVGNARHDSEYRPGIERKDGDVPPLNEAIPVDSGSFSEESLEEDIVVPKDSETEKGGDQMPPFEEMEEAVFDEAIEEEVEESEQREAMKKKILGSDGQENQEQGESLDIF